MAEVIRMPRMSDTMTEGVFVEWHKKVGDKVKSGDVLAEVETDKATMELESYDNGVLLYVGVEAGSAAPVDSIIAIIGSEGESFEELLAAEEAKDASATKESAEEKEEMVEAKAEPATKEVAPVTTPEPQVTEVARNEDGRLKASPLARKIAEDKGIPLAQVNGTGDGGRIIRRDVEGFVPQVAANESKAEQVIVNIPTYVGEESFDEVAVSQMRKTIAGRLSESKFSAPHFYLTISVNMDNAIASRKSMNEVAPVKISFNDMIVKASALALRKHSAVNSSWLGDKIRTNHHVHVGVAVAIDDGLVVPVIRFADGKTLSQISAETGDLAGKARARKLQPQDWEGNTFTISNLGMMGIEEFTAIINPPDACILAVGGINQVPVVRDGQIVPGNIMKLTMSCDHRVVDGATGAQFLQTLKDYLEDPVRMLV